MFSCFYSFQIYYIFNRTNLITNHQTNPVVFEFTTMLVKEINMSVSQNFFG